ncbi:unnamed protein product, partial [Allacma fusca]
TANAFENACTLRTHYCGVKKEGSVACEMWLERVSSFDLSLIRRKQEDVFWDKSKSNNFLPMFAADPVYSDIH